jgi:hypothetical protein
MFHCSYVSKLTTIYVLMWNQKGGKTVCIISLWVLRFSQGWLVYWVVMLCGPVGWYQRFGETYCQPWCWRPPKHWYPSASPYSVKTQKTNIDMACILTTITVRSQLLASLMTMEWCWAPLIQNGMISCLVPYHSSALCMDSFKRVDTAHKQ